MSELPIGGPGFNAGSFIAKAINEGLSMNKALATFRDAGMKMGNQAFRSAYANVREAIGGRDVISSLDYDAIPPGEAFTDWAAGASGRYATFVTSLTRLPGEVEMDRKFYIHVTDEPHTPQEAVDAHAAHLTDEAQTDKGYPMGSYQGGYVTSMTRTIDGPG